MKINVKKILIFLFSVLFIFCYTYFFRSLFTDEIWCYGFGYNIVSGLVPYKDFNMIVTPLFAFVVAIFINIFGHHLWSMHILNAVMLTIMMFLMYVKLGKKIFILIPVILFNAYPGYNLFSLFLVVILLYFDDSDFENKEIIVSLLVSLIFLTKQTVGLFLFIPMLFYSKNKLKSFFTFCVPILLFLIYLISNNALFNFIDYCFLGMFDFASSNRLFILLPFEIIILMILIYKCIKCKFKDRFLFYVLMFQFMTLPIVDFAHFGISFILVLYYVFLNINIGVKKMKYYSFILFFAVFMWGLCENNIYYGNHLYSDSFSYLYGRHIEEYIQDSIIRITEYMEKEKNNYDNVYLLTANAYQIKMNTSYEINKFDLINNGNMGYNGGVRYISEIDNTCKTNSCMFIMYKYEIPDEYKYLQINTDILYYVYDNYVKKEDVDVFDIYTN